MKTERAAEQATVLSGGLIACLRHIVRLALRLRITYSAFDAIARVCFLKAHERNHGASFSDKRSAAAAARSTGLTFRQVQAAKVMTIERVAREHTFAEQALVEKWCAEYASEAGNPTVLPLRGRAGSTFERLVNLVGGNALSYGDLLTQLEAANVLNRNDSGEVALEIDAKEKVENTVCWGPRSGAALTHASLLIAICHHNLFSNRESRYLQLDYWSIDIPEACLDEFELQLKSRVQRSHAKLNDWLTTQRVLLTTDPEEDSVFVAAGAHTFRVPGTEEVAFRSDGTVNRGLANLKPTTAR